MTRVEILQRIRQALGGDGGASASGGGGDDASMSGGSASSEDGVDRSCLLFRVGD
jgi:hypothetical protein